MSGNWEVVIGLEIHNQLATNSKIFSGASTAYGADANTQACLVDLGYPGVLPVLNGEVVRMAAMFGLAVNATIAPRSMFARKNYFYPDLPKGYQISQYELPIVENGEMMIRDEDGNEKVHRHYAGAPRGRCGQVGARGLRSVNRYRPESRRNAIAGNRLGT